MIVSDLGRPRGRDPVLSTRPVAERLGELVADVYVGDAFAAADGSYAGLVAAAATVFWNGPMGRFELPQFTAGTRTIADAVASTSAMSVIGGAETVAALQRFGLRDRVSHVSGESSSRDLRD